MEKNSKIEFVFMPPYYPNLNLIERLWKFFRKNILYDCRCQTFKEFKTETLEFFRNIKRHSEKLRTLLTENFQIIGV
ncbi:MAG: transposase [Victivallales bacterium]|nr:transposase [Victivallales bacterium]